MSVPATGGVPTQGAGEDAIELPAHGDAAFGALMDALAPEPDGTPAGQAAGQAGTGAGADTGGGAGKPGAPDGAGDGKAGRPTAGDESALVAGADGAGAGGAADGGDQGAAAGGAAESAATAGAGDLVPADWTASAADLAPKLGELSTKLEENTTEAYRQQAYTEVAEEHAAYFDALAKHPRLLVGAEVPAIGREGKETLRDTNDAREWQEAVKSLLVEEINDRAGRQLEDSREFLQTVHASIDLFKNNADLIPGTKDFDRELADQFAAFAKPYEVRVEGKLQGYSVPVQPMIESLRTQVAARRTAASQAAAPAGTPQGSPPAAGAASATPQAQSAPEQPQAGIPSRAGNSGEKEDFSTLFGTIGLPGLQI